MWLLWFPSRSSICSGRLAVPSSAGLAAPTVLVAPGPVVSPTASIPATPLAPETGIEGGAPVG